VGLILDPDFELNDGSWLFTGGTGQESIDAVTASHGSKSLRLGLIHGFGGSTQFGRAESSLFTLAVNEPLDIDIRRPATSHADVRLELSLRYPDTSLVPFAQLAPADLPADEWTTFEYDLGATGLEHRLVISTYWTGGVNTIATGEWRADFLELGGLVRKREAIRDAVAAAVATITTANGHAVQVASVHKGSRRHDKIVDWPEAQLTFGEERKAMNEMHRKRCELDLVFVHVAQDGALSAERQLEEVIGSVEQVLETQAGGNFLGLSYVEDVQVVHIPQPVELDGEASRGVRVYGQLATVTYRYDRAQP